MADPNEIAKAKVTVEADLSDFKDAVRETVAETEKLGDAADGAGSRVDASFSKVGEKIEESTKGVRKFVGALSSVAGVATGLIGVVGLLTSAMVGFVAIIKKLNSPDSDEGALKAAESLQTLADKVRNLDEAAAGAPAFAKMLEDLPEITARAQKLREQIQDIEKRSGSRDPNLVVGYKEQVEALKELEAQIEQTRQLGLRLGREITESQNAEIASAEQYGDAMVAAYRSVEEARTNIRDLVERAEIAFLPEEEQIERRAAFAAAEFKKAAEAASLPDDDASVVRMLELIEKQKQAELEAMRNREAAEEKRIEAERERQRIADEAQAAREAEADRRSQERAQREVETIREGLESITAGEFTTVLSSIPRVLQEVSTRLGRLK